MRVHLGSVCGMASGASGAAVLGWGMIQAPSAFVTCGFFSMIEIKID
jgi:hypothetical protein